MLAFFKFVPVICDECSYNFSGQMLLKYILRPLASCPSLHAIIESQPNIIIIRFESVMTDLEHPSPSEVFVKIRLVLEMLQKQLLGLYLPGCAFYFYVWEKWILFLKVNIILK